MNRTKAQRRVRQPWLLGLVLLAGCAQVSSPTGGPLDDTPPQVLQMTPPSGTSNLQLESLTLRFDEYVVSRNATQQLLISPPISGSPEFKTKGKEVLVDFDPSWFASETTYVLNFGDALVDLHESNPAEALFFAFSTGNDLDTLTLEGHVVDHRTGKGVPGLRALFYAESTPWDSIWVGERPRAIAVTNEDGKFTGSYLAPGRYKAIAVDDVNRDYAWNPGEALAFATEAIAAGQAWTIPWLFAPTALPASATYIASSSIDSTGFCRILAPMSEAPFAEDWSLIMEDEALDTRWCRTGDSVKIWTQTPQLVENGLTIWSWSDGADSLPARWSRTPLNRTLAGLSQWPAKSTSTSERFWVFDRVLDALDANLWSFKEDSVFRSLDSQDLAISSSIDGGNSVRIQTTEVPGQRYEINVLPGGVTSREGWSNEDTLVWKWATWPEDHFGNLTLEARDLPGPGWLRCTQKGTSEMELFRVRCESDTSLRWPQLHPGKYEVGFEFDANNDSVWQSMDPMLLQTPEPYFYLPKVLDIRSNWDMEWMWSLKLDAEELE
ncbi:MAG: Ig-like domain-containing domain [Bacteroidetes bacterium]|nr:Ig-like domain-containing domain [Bacteroidota bacterium]